MRIFFFLTLTILLNSFLLSQTTEEWFPAELNIQPFTANFLEPKAGVSYHLGKSQLRLDIGTSRDIYRRHCEDKIISFGADFFTYTRLRGEKEFHFPVETIDYLFGINAGFKKSKPDSEYGFRFRLSHISAHLVDGQFDTGTQDWRNGRKPQVYSREFIELFPFYRAYGARIYAGFTYLIHVSPDYLGKEIYQIGFDYYLIDFVQLFVPFAAYDFKLSKISKYSGNNIISAGIKFGKYDSRGLSILFSYFSGKSIHGEYFDLNEQYSTIGLNLDL
ncbi:MAG: DUF1207 domain-containing protein [Ignavibacteria bacterium]